MGYSNFYELDVWKRARRFSQLMRDVIRRFPGHEQFELVSQIRRAGRSVQANIAEGHGRHTSKDEHHFCVNARGSLSEVLNHLIEAYDEGYISKEELQQCKQEWDELRKVLNGYMSYLKRKLPSPQKDSGQTVAEEDVQYVSSSEAIADTFFKHLS